jgi:hypothetical protein
LGGGEWVSVPNYVAPAGHFVVPTAHKLARFIGFKMEPRSNCGLLFWGHYNNGVTSLPTYRIANSQYEIVNPGQFDLHLAKTFDYSAIPMSALERVYGVEDLNLKPAEPFAPPYLNLNGNFSSLTDAGAKVESAVQSETTGELTLTIKSALLHDGMWLTFYFYEKDMPGWRSEGVLGQVFQVGVVPNTYKAVLSYADLTEAGLEPGDNYAVHYANDWGDIYGYGTFTKGSFQFVDTPHIEFLQDRAAEILENGLSQNNLSLVGKTLTLIIDGRAFVLSTNANNCNISGEIDLGDGYFLKFDIKGNGSNVKEFKVVK